MTTTAVAAAETRRGLGPVPAISLAFAGAADFLFYGHNIGWTIGLFYAALVLVILTCSPQLLKLRSGQVLLAASLGLSAALVESPTAVGVALAIATLMSIVIADRPLVFQTIHRWMKGVASFLLFAPVQLVQDSKRSVDGTRCFEQFLRAFALWAVPILLSLVFAALFYAANPVIGQWVATLYWPVFLGLPKFERFVFWIAVAAAIWVLLKRGAFQPSTVEAPTIPAAHGTDLDLVTNMLLSPATVLRALVAFNVLFAIHNSLDLKYLWSGAELPHGLTFASYAHRSAYPLVATSLLAAVFILLAFRGGEEAKPSRLLNALLIIWVAQNVFLVVSTMQRLALYVDFYSLTYLRVAAMIWLGLVVVGLVLILVRVIADKSSTWLLNSNTLAVLAALYVSAFIDYGAIIANHNVRSAGEFSVAAVRPVYLDVKYLSQIGPSALPALRRYVATVADFGVPGGFELRKAAAAQVVTSLEQELAAQQSNWRHWTLRGARLLSNRD